MTTLKFQTNLNCGRCVAAVAPHLDNDPAIRRWSVDTADPKKVLTVEGEGVSPEQVERHPENQEAPQAEAEGQQQFAQEVAVEQAHHGGKLPCARRWLQAWRGAL